MFLWIAVSGALFTEQYLQNGATFSKNHSEFVLKNKYVSEDRRRTLGHIIILFEEAILCSLG